MTHVCDSRQIMARCDEGYLCSVCGAPVETLAESELYLRYVAGWIDRELLHTAPDRHLQCNPALAQFIVDPRFEPVVCEGPFAKKELDPEFVREREELLTRAWQRLVELEGTSAVIDEYPLGTHRDVSR